MLVCNDKKSPTPELVNNNNNNNINNSSNGNGTESNHASGGHCDNDKAIMKKTSTTPAGLYRDMSVPNGYTDMSSPNGVPVHANAYKD